MSVLLLRKSSDHVPQHSQHHRFTHLQASHTQRHRRRRRLFVTDSLGETHVDVASLAGKSYQQIAFDVLSVLLPDFSETELKACIDEAYGAQWSDEKITPVKPLGDDT